MMRIRLRLRNTGQHYGRGQSRSCKFGAKVTASRFATNMPAAPYTHLQTKQRQISNIQYQRIVGSVAEPEPVERQLFAGAGAEVFLAQLRSRVCYTNPKFSILKFEVDFKNHNFVAIYCTLKNLLMVIYDF
jgi:hypothetical protein